MKCVFDKCFDAVNCANENKTFGFYYSEKQNPDLNIHIHDCCEILMCMSGGKNFLINDCVYDVNDGDIFVINQFEAHKITFELDTVFKRYVMQVHPEFVYSQSTVETNLAQCFYVRGKSVSHKLSLTGEERSYLINKINELNGEDGFGDDIAKKIAATEVLMLVNRAFIRQGNVAANEKTGNAINKAIHFINENFMYRITLETIAKNSYVSVNQLCRLFNRYCGTTVSKYLVSKRITEAKKALASGKSVTDAAIQCGFEDYSNFIRVFKKHVGITPGKYK